MKIVEFWILEGKSKTVVIYNTGKSEKFSLNETDLYENNNNIKKIYKFISVDDLLTILAVNNTDPDIINDFKQKIVNLKHKRKQFFSQNSNE